jgi:hypothetical protein
VWDESKGRGGREEVEVGSLLALFYNMAEWDVMLLLL